MKILLINPSTEIGDIGLFPSGLAYVAKAVIKSGREVDIWDFNALRPSWDMIEKKIQQKFYDVIGIGGLIVVYSYVEKLIKLIKKYHPKTKIIVGDSLGASVPDLVLTKLGADCVCLAEGEHVILNFLEALEQNKDLSLVKGIAYLKDNKYRRYFVDRIL